MDFPEVVNWVNQAEERLQNIEANALAGFTRVTNKLEDVYNAHRDLVTKVETAVSTGSQLGSDIEHKDIVQGVRDFGKEIDDLTSIVNELSAVIRGK